MTQKTQHCYMCKAVATSKEHVPPQCLFPKANEGNGKNYRQDLITVPSCDKHNSKRSCDDQFLMLSLIGLFGNNDIAAELEKGRVSRTLDRKPHIIESIFLDRQKIYLKNDNAPLKLIIGKPDYIRLQSCFEKIFYGLYRHHFNRNFTGTIKIFCDFLQYTNENSIISQKIIKKLDQQDFSDVPVFGSNPQIFYYKFTKPDINNIVACKIVLYNNACVYGAFANTEPNDLVSLLIKNGMEINFDFESEILTLNKYK